MQTKCNVFLWILYDFANSIVMVVFFLYFAQWVVIDRGLIDFWFNLTFTISALLLLFTVPLTGFCLDKFLRRINGLRYTTMFTALFFVTCALLAIYNKEVSALIFYTLGLYTYLLSFTFYTPLINDIAPPTKLGLVSGLGIAANYLGQLAGLLIALPFATGYLTIFNSTNRAETLLPSVIIFFILSLPTLFFFKEPKLGRQNFRLIESIKGLFQETKKLFLFPGIALFLTSYFMFNDAVLTAANNFPIFLERVWGVSDTTKTIILVGILATSALGGFLSGLMADKFGHKRTLIFILSGWVVIMPLIGLLTNFTLFVVFTTLMGFWFGANWTVSRSVMSYLAPPSKHNLAFAYFGLAERASSFIGPIVWGVIVSSLTALGSYRYRIAVLAITVFIILGLIALIPIKSDRDILKTN